MKVSVDYDEPAMTPGGLDNGLVWTIFDWEIGGLQPSSSGSPLLDNNGRIRGQAWYINSLPICQGVNSGGQSSGYGRLNVAWDAKATPQTRLKEWLDPGNTGAMTTDFYPPQSLPDSGASLQFYKADNFDCDESISPVIRLINNGSEVVSTADLTYSYNNGPLIPFTWTGNLAANQSTLLDLPALGSGQTEHIVSVNLTEINGLSSAIGESANISTAFYNVPSFSTNYINFEITTDRIGEETSWDLLDEDGNLIESRPTYFYDNLQTYNHEIALQPGCYTLVIKDSFGDGMCCFEGAGKYSLTTEGGELIKEGGNFDAREYIRFKISSALAVKKDFTEQLTIYPNPTSGIFTITVADGAIGSQYVVYNVTGQRIAGGILKEIDNTIDLSGVSKGIYLVKIHDLLQNVLTSKLVIGN